MENLIANQIQILEAIKTLLTNFKKDGSDRKTPDAIKRRLSTLDAYWHEFENNHDQLSTADDRSHDYFTSNYYQKTHNFYIETRTYVERFLTSEAKAPSPAIIRPATPLGPTPGPSITFPVGTKQQPTFQQPTSNANTQNHSSGSHRLDEMLRKQLSNFKAFRYTISTTQVEDDTEKWELEDMLRSIQSRWAIIDSLHWDIDSESMGDNQEYEARYKDLEQKYRYIKKTINSKIWSVSHREKSTPQMDIPSFNGNYHQWMSFKDLFIEAIHSNRSLNDAQKMQFLKSKLKGEAEKIVQHLNISSDNYQVCWEILNHRYDNKKIIFSSHINLIMNLPVMQQQSAANIKKIHDTTKECLYAIKNLGVDIDTWDPLVIHIVTQKLDSVTYNDYIQSLISPRDLPTLQEFFEFMEAKFTSLEASKRKQDPIKQPQQHFKSFTSSNDKGSSSSSPKKPFKPSSNKNNSRFSKYLACTLCNKNHGIFRCSEFLKLQPSEKKSLVAKLNYCFNCLHNHNGNDCTSEKRCHECNGRHNTLLHEAFLKSQKSDDNDRQHDSHVAQNSKSNIAEVLLATAQLKVQGVDGTYQNMRALIDQGSQTSLISEKAAQKLGLPRQRCKGVIFGVGAKENNCKGILNISCLSNQGDYTFTTEVLIMNNLVNNLPNNSFTKPTWDFLQNIQLADPNFNVSSPVDLLLGADIYSSIILNGIIREKNSPIAQQTRLGWILCGNVKSYQCNIVLNNVTDLERFWTTEDIVETTSMSQEDDQCVQYYKTTTTRNEEGRYIVRLPLKPNHKQLLGDSKFKSIAQFRQLENKFQKNEKIARDYKSFIHEYLNLGHMKQSMNANCNQKPSVYLPHHCVQRAESTTTSLRVVFNASAKTSTGHSLNDVMYRGPNLQQDLFKLILKWRQYEFAFTADIEKMFRQILLHQDDQLYHQIVWRDSPNEILRNYQLATVTYGTKAAPFLAMMTLKQLASDEGHKYTSSKAVKVLEDDFFMDDLLSGCHSLQAAKELQSDLITLLKSGGFNLRKWNSNKLSLLEGVHTAQQNDQQGFDFKHEESTKTLGLRWCPPSDQFEFKLKIDTRPNLATKRQMLSDISKIFDPLGWLSPVSTKLKILFQEVWLHQNLTWDDKLPEKINMDWNTVKVDLDEINNIKITRWLSTGKQENLELHGFCDASTKAYACVIYCRIKKQQEPPSIILVAAKSRLTSPNKNISLPRLELNGALLLAKLMKNVLECLSEHNITIYGWSDSTAVLGWLHGDPGRWKTYVANRVIQTTSIIPSVQWNYVKTNENPADPASRGITARQLKQHPLWWTGPAWLSTFDSQPIKSRVIYETDKEIKSHVKQNVITMTQNSDRMQANVSTTSQNNSVVGDVIRSHSNLTRVIRVVAWILRFVYRNYNKPTYLTITELRKAQFIIIKYIQQSEFTEDINCIKKNGTVNSKSRILPLNPFLDREGMLRVGGRLKNANISQEMIHPLIIPHSSHYTNLLIDHAHKLTYHGGPRITLAWLRQKYWVVGGNNAVKKRLRSCITCKRNNPTKQHQIMGDLPESRVTPTRPFYNAGVDYTGYVDVKSNKGRGIKTTKGYIAVFVCMATKAVHLELVSDLSTSAFIAALRRMAARRGAPRHLWSDNGTNFIGANNVIQKEFTELKSIVNDEFLSEISMMEIEWHFNAPSWPSAGGLWEAAVKSLKHHLRRVVGEQKLTYEEYSTLLAQLEACLNARPLCALTEDPNDLDYLTPSHFLASGPVLNIIETERDARTRWNLTQKLFHDIWKRWRAEYLTQMSVRSKWQSSKPNIKKDDIVLIHEANLPAAKWALGRIIDLHPGKDGFVRVVSVRTKNGILKRPITKISVLPLEDEPTSGPKQKQKVVLPQDEVPSPSEKGNAPKTRRNISLFTMAIMFMTMLISTASCADNSTNLSTISTNQSIYFDKDTNMHLIRDEWKLVVYYNLDPYWESTELFEKYVLHLENICLNAKRRLNCDVIPLQLRHNYIELQYYNDMLLSQHFSSHARLRRGLINGVGYVANSLFGTLDQHFAEQYKKDIELVRENQSHLGSLWKNQTSVVEAEFNLLKRMEGTMSKQHKIFNQHLNELEEAKQMITDAVQKGAASSEFAIYSIIANNLAMNLKSIQATLINTIANIYNGQFDMHLITPNQLRDELNTISQQISKELTLPIQNVYTDLIKIYQLLKVRTRMTKDYLIFEITIPLIDRDRYEIYNMITIPQQVGENMVNIITIADNVAINLHKDIFMPLSDKELKECLSFDSSTRLCALQSPVYHMKSDINLCLRVQKSNECIYHTTPCHNKWIQLHSINTYLYFCCGQCTLRIICADQITSEQLSKAGIISVREGCVIKGESFTVMSHRRLTSKVQTQAEIVRPLIPSINNIINLTIPVSKVKLENDNNTEYIREINEQIIKLKAETPEVERISYHDIHHYIAIYVLVGAATAVAAAYVIWRVRRSMRRRRGSARLASARPVPRPRAGVRASNAASSDSVSVQKVCKCGKCVSASERAVPTNASARCSSARVHIKPPLAFDFSDTGI